MKDTPQIIEFKKSIGNTEMLSRLSVMAMNKFAEDTSKENLENLAHNLEFQVEEALAMMQMAHNIAYDPKSPKAMQTSLLGAIRSAMRSDHQNAEAVRDMCSIAMDKLCPKEVIQ